MTTETLACPYCNAFVTAPPEAVPGQRIPCPRCGEAFPYRPRDEGAFPGHPSRATAVHASATGMRTARRRWPNWVIAVAVLGLMAGMAAVGVFWALKTVPDRRGHDRKEPVGYLPSDCDVVLGVHVPKLLEASAGRDLTRELDQTLAGAGLPPFQRWTGLRWEDVEQAFLGVRVADRLLPRMVLVVQTRDTYDAEKLREALKVTRTVERGQKTLHRFRPEGAAFDLELWCPSETILVVGLVENDLDAVPLTPHSGVDHLPQWLQFLLRDPTGANAQLWLMAHSDDWKMALDKSLLRVLLVRVPEADQEQLRSVQTLAVWLRFEEDIRVTTALRCPSVEGAKELRAYLVNGDVVAPENIEIKKDVWLTIQAQTSAEAIRQRLKRGLGR